MQSFKKYITEQNDLQESIANEAAGFVGRKLLDFLLLADRDWETVVAS